MIRIEVRGGEDDIDGAVTVRDAAQLSNALIGTLSGGSNVEVRALDAASVRIADRLLARFRAMLSSSDARFVTSLSTFLVFFFTPLVVQFF